MKNPRIIEKSEIFKNNCSLVDTIVVPESYSRESLDADLIIFVGFTKSSTNFNAYSNYCVQRDSTNQPIAGYLIFNSSKMKITEQKLEFNQNLTVHEILHVLAINKRLFPIFPLNQYNETVIEKNHENKLFYRGDTLVRISRKHFGCSTLTKLPLENEGSEGTQGNHLEATVFGNDVMVASSKSGYRLTKFSLAILQDSGW